MKNKKKEEPQDFLAVIKLVSGEEIISNVTSCEEKDRILFSGAEVRAIIVPLIPNNWQVLLIRSEKRTIALSS